MSRCDDDSGPIDLHALLREGASSAPSPNESPHRYESVCDPLATVPADLHLLALRLSEADAALAAERDRVARALEPARRAGRTRLAITVALAAGLAFGQTAIGLSSGGAATTPAKTEEPPPLANARSAAPAVALARPTPLDPPAVRERTPATPQPIASVAPPVAVARPHRAAASEAKTDELAKPPSEEAPSDAPAEVTTEAAPDPTTAAAAALPSAAPAIEAVAPAEPSPPAAPPRAEEPMTLDEAMRSAVREKKEQPSPSRDEVARGSEQSATPSELQ